MTCSELFIPVESFEDRYHVTNTGRVWSVKSETFLKYTFRKDRSISYAQVSLYDGARRYVRYVHILVARAFIGAPPEGCEVSHVDGDRSNNDVSNLMYETRKDNLSRKIDHGTAFIGRNSSNAKLSDELVAEIKSLYKTGQYRQRDLAEMYNTSQSNISFIVRGKTWQYPEHWDFNNDLFSLRKANDD